MSCGTLAEWLRRGPAKAVCYACVSSNLTGVDIVFSLSLPCQFSGLISYVTHTIYLFVDSKLVKEWVFWGHINDDGCSRH